jgi:hypothetical protein
MDRFVETQQSVIAALSALRTRRREKKAAVKSHIGKPTR